jgi:hypothetical protein
MTIHQMNTISEVTTRIFDLFKLNLFKLNTNTFIKLLIIFECGFS